jgi:8-oxo-dGTP diphosphatase
MPDAITDVAVGVIVREHNQVLLGDRPTGKPWAGWWELPGGKLEPGESVLAALARELQEELGLSVLQAHPWVTHVHQYPTTTVRLHFCRVTRWSGEPQSLEGQHLKWVSISDALALTDLLPATYPPLRWLQLPDRYLISSAHSPAGFAGFIERLTQAFDGGIELVQWREPAWAKSADSQALESAFDEVLSLCRAHGARLLVNSIHPADWWARADGVHLRAIDLNATPERPQALHNKLMAASTHTPADLHHAKTIGADFAVLGPVLPTASHPGEPALGWDAFDMLRQDAGLPVYAIGGQTPQTLLTAQSRGAHGIAGIRQLLG